MQNSAAFRACRPACRARRLGLTLSLLFMLLIAAPRVSAQCMYDVTLIAPPACPGGGVPYVPRSSGEDMSETGIVVGWYEWCDDGPLYRKHPFMWSESTGFQQLQRPPGYDSIRATGISSDGRYIVGWGGKPALSQAWTILWDNGVPMEIPPVGDSNVIKAIDVTNDGILAGITEDPNGTGRFLGFRITKSGFALLDSPPNTPVTVIDMNDSGTVSGSIGSVNGVITGTLWDLHDTTYLDCGVAGAWTRAFSVNNRGSAAGAIKMPQEKGGTTYAGYWRGDTPVILPLPSYCEGMRVTDVADTGQMVGTCDSAPILWNNYQAVDLEMLVDAPIVIAIHDAARVSNSGQILVSMFVTGDEYLFSPTGLLTPRGASTSDLNKDCSTDVFDLFLIFQEWGRSDSFADLDNNGTVDVFDLLDLLAGWG